jgi:hypothetical protein
MSNNENIHRKQFIALKSNLIKPDFPYVSIIRNGPWYVYLGRDLLFRSGFTSQGISYLILGICYSVKPGEVLETHLEQARDVNDIIINKRYWGGRWVLFFDGHIFTDATANLNVFYTQLSGGIISSSLALIHTVSGVLPEAERDEAFKELGWFPAPSTRIPGVYSLLAFQQITPDFRVLAYSKKSNLSQLELDDLYDEIIKSIQYFLKSVSCHHKLSLPLTGGIDSRTILSLLFSSELNFYSYTSDYDEIKFHDVLTPWQITRFYEVKHLYFKPKYSHNHLIYHKRLKEYASHTLSNCIDKDSAFYAGNQYPEIPAVMLRGAGWACFRGFYTNDFNQGNNEDSKILQLSKMFHQFDKYLVLNDAIKEWFSQLKKTDLIWDWRMQFYIDQRMNAWDGTIEQSIDLTNHYPIHVVNSDYQFELLWLIMNKEKIEGRSSVIQINIIKKTFPGLLNWRFNRFNGVVNPSKKIAVSILKKFFRYFL